MTSKLTWIIYHLRLSSLTYVYLYVYRLSQDLKSFDPSMQQNLDKLESIAAQIRPVLSENDQTTLNEQVAEIQSHSDDVRETLNQRLGSLHTNIAEVRHDRVLFALDTGTLVPE